MNVELVIGREACGTFRLVNYLVQIDYDQEPFEFDIRARREGQNISEILHQYARVDSIRLVKLIAQTPIVINNTRVYVDSTILLCERSEIVNWSVRTNAPTDTQPIIQELHPALRAAEIVIAGTVRSVLPDVKEEHRKQIRERAKRAAHLMIDHGNALLAFLNPTPHMDDTSGLETEGSHGP